MPKAERPSFSVKEKSLRVSSLLLTMLAFCHTAFASGINMEFLDGRPSTQKEVRRLLKNIDLSCSADSLNAVLVDEGFLDAWITRHEKDTAAVLMIHLGPQYLLGHVIIKGPNPDTLASSKKLSKKLVEKITDSIIAEYRAEGFYFASLTAVAALKRNGAVDLVLETQPGPLVTLSAVSLMGLEKTDQEFVRKFLSLNPGDTIVDKKLYESVRRLRQLDFLQLTESPKIIPESGFNTARVVYSFREKKQFAFEGAGGYVPDEKGYFSWLLHLRGNNLFGTGQRAALFADKREKDKSVLEISYGRPVFLLGLDKAEINLTTRDYRDQFYQFGLALSYETYLKNRFTLKSTLAWKNVVPSDTMLRSFNTYEAAIAFKTGSVDNRKDAPAQLILSWELKYSGRRYNRNQNAPEIQTAVYNDTRADLSVEADLPLFASLRHYQKVQFRDIESSESILPLSELFFIGGPLNLRGYRNDQFAARRMLLLNSEWRFYLSTTTSVYPFADGAFFELPVLDDNGAAGKENYTRWGYGWGISLLSENRSLIVEFSWGKNSNLDEPRLHIRLLNQF